MPNPHTEPSAEPSLGELQDRRRQRSEPIEEEPEQPEAAFGRSAIPPAPDEPDDANTAQEERAKEEAAATDPA